MLQVRLTRTSSYHPDILHVGFVMCIGFTIRSLSNFSTTLSLFRGFFFLFRAIDRVLAIGYTAPMIGGILFLIVATVAWLILFGVFYLIILQKKQP